MSFLNYETVNLEKVPTESLVNKVIWIYVLRTVLPFTGGRRRGGIDSSSLPNSSFKVSSILTPKKGVILGPKTFLLTQANMSAYFFILVFFK